MEICSTKHFFWKWSTGSYCIFKKANGNRLKLSVASISKPVFYEIILFDGNGEHIPIFLHRRECILFLKNEWLNTIEPIQLDFVELKPVEMDHMTSLESSPRSLDSSSESLQKRKRFSLPLRKSDDSLCSSSPESNSPKSPVSPSNVRRFFSRSSDESVSPRKGMMSPRHQSMFAELIAKTKEKYDSK